jgi:hypothetical protein
MWQTLSSWIKGTIWAAIAGLLAALLFPAVLEFHRAIDATTISKLSPSKLFLAAFGLLLACLILAALLYETKRQRILLREYVPDPDWPGTYRHIKNRELHVCGVCLSPVFMDAKEKCLCCNKCNKAILPRQDWYK